MRNYWKWVGLWLILQNLRTPEFQVCCLVLKLSSLSKLKFGPRYVRKIVSTVPWSWWGLPSTPTIAIKIASFSAACEQMTGISLLVENQTSSSVIFSCITYSTWKGGGLLWLSLSITLAVNIWILLLYEQLSWNMQAKARLRAKEDPEYG